MKRLVGMLALAALLWGGLATGQPIGEVKVNEVSGLYITHFYVVDVYLRGRKVDTIPRGTRAQIDKTTYLWMYVRYMSAAGVEREGWIRR